MERTQAIFWSYLCVSLFSFAASYPFVYLFEVSGVVAGALTANLISIVFLLRAIKNTNFPNG